MLLQLILNGFITGMVYALVALGFSLIFRSTGIFHIAHAAVYTLAAYLFYLFFSQLGMPMFVSSLFAVILTGITGAMMDVTVYYPLKRNEASSSAMIVSSIGMMTVIINCVALIWGNQTKTISTGISQTFSFTNPLAGDNSGFNELVITMPQVYQGIVSGIVILFMLFLLKQTRYGKTVQALCDNDTLIEIFGRSLKKYRVSIFFIGSALAATGSVLTAIDLGMDPYVGLPILLTSAAAVIIGGVNSFGGAVLGGMVLGLLKALVVWKFSAQWEDLFVFLLLVIFLLVKPEGIVTTKSRQA